MSGFDPGWLDLREPVDHRSRARAPLAILERRFAGHAHVAVADLGAGSGSTLRALAPLLGRSQRWTLVEHDLALLEHAKRRLTAWADEAEMRGEILALGKGEAAIAVAFEACDLALDPLPASAATSDLVTASAFFDLVGRDWLDDFVAKLARAGRPLYAPLIYDGAKRFAPSHALDAFMLDAFNAHQRGDKGFGPALGPEAGGALLSLAARNGFSASSGPSPWRLGVAERALTAELVEGMARAVGETADPPDGLAAWRAFRRAAVPLGTAYVGHVDLFLSRVG